MKTFMALAFIGHVTPTDVGTRAFWVGRGAKPWAWGALCRQTELELELEKSWLVEAGESSERWSWRGM